MLREVCLYAYFSSDWKMFRTNITHVNQKNILNRIYFIERNCHETKVHSFRQHWFLCCSMDLSVSLRQLHPPIPTAAQVPTLAPKVELWAPVWATTWDLDLLENSCQKRICIYVAWTKTPQIKTWSKCVQCECYEIVFPSGKREYAKICLCGIIY